MVMQAVVTSNNINNHKQSNSHFKTSLFKIPYYYKPQHLCLGQRTQYYSQKHIIQAPKHVDQHPLTINIWLNPAKKWDNRIPYLDTSLRGQRQDDMARSHTLEPTLCHIN